MLQERAQHQHQGAALALHQVEKPAAVHVWKHECVLCVLSCMLCVQTCVLRVLHPRSVMLWNFEGRPHLLVGLGDGQLHHWKMSADTGGPSWLDVRKIQTGRDISK